MPTEQEITNLINTHLENIKETQKKNDSKRKKPFEFKVEQEKKLRLLLSKIFKKFGSPFNLGIVADYLGIEANELTQSIGGVDGTGLRVALEKKLDFLNVQFDKPTKHYHFLYGKPKLGGSKNNFDPLIGTFSIRHKKNLELKLEEHLYIGKMEEFHGELLFKLAGTNITDFIFFYGHKTPFDELKCMHALSLSHDREKKGVAFPLFIISKLEKTLLDSPSVQKKIIAILNNEYFKAKKGSKIYRITQPDGFRLANELKEIAIGRTL